MWESVRSFCHASPWYQTEVIWFGGQHSPSPPSLLGGRAWCPGSQRALEQSSSSHAVLARKHTGHDPSDYFLKQSHFLVPLTLVCVLWGGPYVGGQRLTLGSYLLLLSTLFTGTGSQLNPEFANLTSLASQLVLGILVSSFQALDEQVGHHTHPAFVCTFRRPELWSSCLQQ